MTFSLSADPGVLVRLLAFFPSFCPVSSFSPFQASFILFDLKCCSTLSLYSNFALFIASSTSVYICCVLLPASLRRRNAVCYCQLHDEEDMLCVTASFMMKKICCVLPPASLRRRYICVLL